MQTMIGEYRHNIDAKGRLAIPAKFREELGQSFVVCKGTDGCIFVYSQSAWDELEKKINSYPISTARQLQRFFLSSACDCQFDSQGRVLLPINLRQFATLQKEVAIIGVSGRAEIWDSQKWDDYNNNMTPEDILGAMEEIGF